MKVLAVRMKARPVRLFETKITVMVGGPFDVDRSDNFVWTMIALSVLSIDITFVI